MSNLPRTNCAGPAHWISRFTLAKWDAEKGDRPLCPLRPDLAGSTLGVWGQSSLSPFSRFTLAKCVEGGSLLDVKFFLILLAAALLSAAPVDLAGRERDPFRAPAAARVFIFVRSDCPVTNRYAPELQHLFQEFSARSVEFWLVYPDPSETPEQIKKHMLDYGFPGQPLRDPQHELVKRAQAETAPEAAVFDSKNNLMYHGRIDDLWVSPGRARPMPTTHDLEDAIAAVLDGRAPRQAVTHAVGCSLADVAPNESK